MFGWGHLYYCGQQGARGRPSVAPRQSCVSLIPLHTHPPIFPGDVLLPHLHSSLLMIVQVTTTIYTQATNLPAPSGPGAPSLPIGAIVGGVSAGAVLAIVVTVGWICWGRSIERTTAKKRKEAVSHSEPPTLAPAKSGS